MSNDQTLLKCYSDDGWWDLQDDDHHHPDELLNYEMATPLDHAGRGRHNAKLFTSAPQYPQTTAHMQCVGSPEILMKRPAQVPTSSPAKPKRRRGRGGATATTTFLSSTIMNFRELVQQHTGMSSGSTTVPPSSYYASCDQKGPITLCFAGYSSTSDLALGFNHVNH